MNKTVVAILIGCAIVGIGVNYAMTDDDPLQNAGAGPTAMNHASDPASTNFPDAANSPRKNQGQVALNGYASLWSSTAQTRTGSAEQSAAPSERDGNRPAPAGNASPQDAKDPTRKLIARYENEKIPQVREMLLNELGSSNQPEVVELAKRLALSADPEQRRDGFALIQRLQISTPDVRNAIRQVLATDQTSLNLIPALVALVPATTVDVAESHQTVSLLIRLAQNSDDAVRSESILRLAQWDTSGEGTSIISNALTDESQVVRDAAKSAMATVRARSGS
jgi:hypothetical protein